MQQIVCITGSRDYNSLRSEVEGLYFLDFTIGKRYVWMEVIVFAREEDGKIRTLLTITDSNEDELTSLRSNKSEFSLRSLAYTDSNVLNPSRYVVQEALKLGLRNALGDEFEGWAAATRK